MIFLLPYPWIFNDFLKRIWVELWSITEFLNKMVRGRKTDFWWNCCYYVNMYFQNNIFWLYHSSGGVPGPPFLEAPALLDCPPLLRIFPQPPWKFDTQILHENKKNALKMPIPPFSERSPLFGYAPPFKQKSSAPVLLAFRRFRHPPLKKRGGQELWSSQSDVPISRKRLKIPIPPLLKGPPFSDMPPF